MSKTEMVSVRMSQELKKAILKRANTEQRNLTSMLLFALTKEFLPKKEAK